MKTSSADKTPSPPRGRRRKILLLVGGIAAGLIAAELILAILNVPTFQPPHTFPPQFEFLAERDDGFPVYVNLPAAKGICFEYPDNPRGYFDPDNAIRQRTNVEGFRDAIALPFALRASLRQPGRERLLFLGDSFTFGEGVRDEDVYPRVTATLLNRRFAGRGKSFESFNMGVGGYNTQQSLYALERWGLPLKADIVVLGYVLNDAEPRLFVFDSQNRPVRRDREAKITEGTGDPRPPQTLLYRSRLAQLIWRWRQYPRREQQTVSFYRSLYDHDPPAWQDNRQALQKILAICRDRKIPCIVVCFPILYQLDEDYPFADIHNRVRQEVQAGGGIFVDLLDRLKGRDARTLWVHPTDPHPNETVHAAAAEAVAEAVAEALTPPAEQ